MVFVCGLRGSNSRTFQLLDRRHAINKTTVKYCPFYEDTQRAGKLVNYFKGIKIPALFAAARLLLAFGLKFALNVKPISLRGIKYVNYHSFET